MDEILKLLRPKPPYKPKEGLEDFIKSEAFISGEPLRPSRRVNYKIFLSEFKMPNELKKIFAMDDAFKQRQLLKVPFNADKYDKFFTNLLYAEEYNMNEELKMYDRQKVTMKKYEDYFILKVPGLGLAEKRPSVLPGDYILVVKCGDEEIYQGFVHEVRKNSIVLGFGMSFLQDAYSPNARFNVRFTFNRVSMRRMHQALYNSNSKVNFWRLFPILKNHQKSNEAEIEENIRNIEFHTPQNQYQRRAVAIIKSGSHHPWPFIVFGPPGTGKSATIVEAMWQLLDDTSTRILACAASNAAADWLLKKLSDLLSPEVMVRVNAVSQNPEKLDSKLHCYCVIEDGKYQFPILKYIEKRRVVVTTCITAGAVYALGGTKPYTHIFVDEAGQALEPEIVTALQNASKDTKIILAGDPKQLGPLVRSPIAREFDLGTSLIERLATCEFYDFCKTCKYGVKLLMNYRSHPEILKFPNTEFYEDDLISSAEREITHNLANFSLLPKKGYPLMFWCVKGNEDREGQSPSWFNAYEAAHVLVVVKQLLREDVKPEEIGVVTPYVKQVDKIKKLLKKKGILKVDIGTVEKFQGQERRVIIISAVRSEFLGFLGEPRRFCVSVTRAQALLVVIGNPDLLSSNKLWRAWLKEVKKKGGYSTKAFPNDA